jgi:hypothetical protein
VHVFYRLKGKDFFLLFQSDNFTMITFRIIHLIVVNSPENMVLVNFSFVHNTKIKFDTSHLIKSL